MQLVDLNLKTREYLSIILDPHYPGYVSVTYPSKRPNTPSRTEWYPLADFQKNNPTLVSQLGPLPNIPQSDLGQVTHAGEFYLEDTAKDWVNNIYVGFMVWISRGTGEGQVKNIKSNNKNTLTIDTAWTTTPDTKSQYVISKDIHDVKILGNTLPQYTT